MIGFLTILGFALYDVVVVFDKVRENTRGITGNATRTYGEAANLAVNQTLMRSINTAIVALLPVGGLLFIGAGLLGAGTLKDLGLVLFVGMLAAVYSSIFFATPVLVDLKEQEPQVQAHTPAGAGPAGVRGERRAPGQAVRPGRGGPDGGRPTRPAQAGRPRRGRRRRGRRAMPGQSTRPGRGAGRKRPGARRRRWPAAADRGVRHAVRQQSRKRPGGARPSGSRTRKR